MRQKMAFHIEGVPHYETPNPYGYDEAALAETTTSCTAATKALDTGMAIPRSQSISECRPCLCALTSWSLPLVLWPVNLLTSSAPIAFLLAHADLEFLVDLFSLHASITHDMKGAMAVAPLTNFWKKKVQQFMTAWKTVTI